MTYIEFFEKDAIENVCSCLTRPVEHIVLVGDNERVLNAHKLRYEAFFVLRGHRVEVQVRRINRNNLNNIVEKLSEIVETYEDCVFDLTGGEDLYLVGMGIVYARYPEKNIQLHRFNIRNNTLQDCDSDGTVICETDVPGISVEENICIYGGDIIYEENSPTGTRRWPTDGDFLEDIDRMWSVCRQEPTDWNTFINFLIVAESHKEAKKSGLTTVVPVGIYSETASRRRISSELVQYGLLTEFRKDGAHLTITYKNENVKRCLQKEGQALEMKIWRLALDIRDHENELVYQDARNGVSIDWDGDFCPIKDSVNVENEIDVLMMHGMVPVFVSCKNGRVEVDELYKLRTVATSFGGKYAKPVLVLSSANSTDFTKRLHNRAEELGIRVLWEIHKKSDSELQRELRSLWSN